MKLPPSLVLMELQSVGSSVPVPRFCQFSNPALFICGWASAAVRNKQVASSAVRRRSECFMVS